MTFRQVVIKTFLGNVRQYLSFFLCSTFSIVVFFINVTIVFNKDISKGGSADLMTYLLPVTVIAITLFSIFFIVYANNSFVKARYKEFGVYQTLGMDNKEIRKFVNGQNLIIGGSSVIIGVIFGALLSRLFQMAIIRILDLQHVSYHLDFWSFLVTLGTFFMVFAIVFFENNRKMKKLDILGLIKEAKQMPQMIVTKKTRILSILGVLLMVVSLCMVLFLLNQEKYNSKGYLVLIFVSALFMGIYLTIAKGGEMLLCYRKKKAACQFALLSLAETEKKYSQNKKILFVLSILSSVTIVLVASPYALLSLTESIAEMNVNSVEYVETASINGIKEEKRQEILRQLPVLYDKKADFIYLYTDKDHTSSVPLVSVELYNQLTGEEVVLEKGQCKSIALNWMPGDSGFSAGSRIQLYGATTNYNFQITTISHGPYFANLSYPCDVILLLTKEDYNELKRKEGQTNWGTYHMIGYENWKETEGVVTQLKKNLSNNIYPVLSIYENYKTLKEGYSAFLFMSTVLGILFFVSGGTVLYFRQFTELAQTKEDFRKLFKIGITQKEIKQILTKELSVIFFLPLLFGTFGGVSIIYMLTHIFGGADVLREFMINSCKVVIVYFIFQGVFYDITRKQYIKACCN